MNKIFIINHYAGVPKYGMEFRHFNIAKELVRKDVEVCIIAASFTHLRDEPKCKFEIIDDVNFIWVKVPIYKNFGFGRFLNMLMFSVNFFSYRKFFPFIPDTVIVSSPSPFAIINALWFKFRYKIKLMYEIRDVWPLSIVELKGYSKNNILILFLNMLDTLGIKYADVILSPLNNINTYIKEKGFKKKVIILPNGISDVPSENYIKKKDNDKFVVGYGGSLGDSNSIMNLINAAILLKSNDSIAFKIIGSGERFDEIKNVILNEQLKNVNLISRVSKEELNKLLFDCDILYKGNPKKHIYKYGISSIKQVEYLLLKKPIIDASYGNNLVRESDSGVVVEEENCVKLAEGIIKLQKMNKEKIAEMGKRGFDYVSKNYLYKNIVNNFIIEIMKNE
jgi:hypothetical protein